MIKTAYAAQVVDQDYDPFSRCEWCRLPVGYPLAPCEDPRCEEKSAALHAAQLVSADEFASFDEIAAIKRREDV